MTFQAPISRIASCPASPPCGVLMAREVSDHRWHFATAMRSIGAAIAAAREIAPGLLRSPAYVESPGSRPPGGARSASPPRRLAVPARHADRPGLSRPRASRGPAPRREGGSRHRRGGKPGRRDRDHGPRHARAGLRGGRPRVGPDHRPSALAPDHARLTENRSLSGEAGIRENTCSLSARAISNSFPYPAGPSAQKRSGQVLRMPTTFR